MGLPFLSKLQRVILHPVYDPKLGLMITGRSRYLRNHRLARLILVEPARHDLLHKEPNAVLHSDFARNTVLIIVNYFESCNHKIVLIDDRLAVPLNLCNVVGYGYNHFHSPKMNKKTKLNGTIIQRNDCG